MDEILRVDGVSDANIMGEPANYSIRAWLNPQALASRNMTAADVANAVRQQNLQVAAGMIGSPPARSNQPFQLPIDTLGRLANAEQFGNIIVKVGQNQVLRPRSERANRTSPGGNDRHRATERRDAGSAGMTGSANVGGANTGGGADTGGGGTFPAAAPPTPASSPSDATASIVTSAARH